MAQCLGTTKSGNRCKLDAQPDSEYCHLHGAAKEKSPPQGEAAAEAIFELENLVPLIVGGAMAVGFILVVKTFGKFIPRF